MALVLGLVALMWAVELVDSLILGGRLDQYGIQPRQRLGWLPTLWAPWLHGGLGHLAANTIPFVILGTLVAWRGPRAFVLVTLTIMVVGGLAVWALAGSGTVHIGASMLVFGYFGFLLLRGYYERSLRSLALAMVVLVLYGGLLWGLFPGTLGVSWQGHLFGFLGGAVAARLLPARYV